MEGLGLVGTLLRDPPLAISTVILNWIKGIRDRGSGQTGRSFHRGRGVSGWPWEPLGTQDGVVVLTHALPCQQGRWVNAIPPFSRGPQSVAMRGAFQDVFTHSDS